MRRRRCAAITSAAVLDEGAGIAEVEHVLARGALLRGPPARDRFRPRRVRGLGAATQHLVEVGAHAIEIDLVPASVVVAPRPRLLR